MRPTSHQRERDSAPRDDVDFPGTPRFAIRRRIGEGAMGVVYDAFDRDLECRVALKTLRRGDAKSLYRFKREFRTLQDIEHPNLIRYGEMFFDADTWFFTMEFIEGVDFYQYVRPAHPMPPALDAPVLGLERGFDEERLRDGMRQLAVAIHTIHRLQIVHRDIKPTNIRVTSRGRVVLLDFGLLTRQEPGDDHAPRGIVGTATYMSPEQAYSGPIGPSSDWYSLGVVLYLALTGRRPFRGKTPMEILMSKLEDAPLAPREWVRDVPQDLDTLCRRLMQSEPDLRPLGDEVVRELGGDPREIDGWIESRAESVDVSFVGRQAELARLNEDLARIDDGEPLLTLVTSPPGMGKSELLRHFAQQGSSDSDRIVVFGRCYERESLPYKALDPIADQLALYLASLADHNRGPLTQSLGYWLTKLFPSFRRVSALLREPSEFLSGLDPQVRRGRMFRAFRELLWRIASRQRLILVIDDFQWADSDSYLLLEEVLRGPDAPALHLVVSVRTDSDESARALAVSIGRRLPVRQRTIELGPLSPGEAAELSERLLNETHRHDERVASAIANRVGGHPLYIRELARHVNQHGVDTDELDVEDAIARRVAALPEPERQLLALVVLSSRPLTHGVLTYAAHVSGGEFDRIVRALRQDALVRPSESVATALEVYHERVASAVHRQLLDDERRSMHAALAAALERGAQVDQPDALLFHLARAGERERAAALAKLAASRATEAGAYDKAVELYRQAIDLADLDRSAMRPLRLALAEALVRAGRGPEAAASFLDAFDGADAQTQLYCGSQAAEQYLISGHIDQGMAAIEMLLAHVGTSLPETPRRALFSLLGCRLRLRLRGWVWRERPLSEIPRNDLLKIDVYRAVSRGLTMVDTVRGADFTARHALLALQLGEVNRVARALAVEAMHLASQGALERARSLAVDVERLVERGDAPDLPLWAMVAKSGVSYFSGEFGQTAELLEQAEEMYQSVMATHWEVNNIRLFRIFSLKFTGRWGDVRRLFGLYVRDAQRRGDRYMEMTLKRHCVFLELAADRPDEGRRWLDEATWSPPAGQFHLQHWFELEARTEVALYKGPDDQAVRRLLEGLAGVERSLLDRVQIIRVSARKLQAQLLLSAAVRTRSRAKLNEVERLASALERERVTYARVFASLIRAGIAAIELDNPKVLYHLRRTIALCEPVGMGLYANVARRLVAGLELSPSSEAEVARIEEQFRAEGVQSPQRLLALLAPGVAALLTHEGGES